MIKLVKVLTPILIGSTVLLAGCGESEETKNNAVDNVEQADKNETVKEEEVLEEPEPVEESEPVDEPETVEEVVEETEDPEPAADSPAVGVTMPFPIGTPLDELMVSYGSPTYDDYFMGARLVVFNEQDGYYLDEATETVSGFMIANPDVSVFGAKVGMTPAEISAVLGEPGESFFDESETQMFANYYYIENHKVIFYSEEEDGPALSVNVISD